MKITKCKPRGDPSALIPYRYKPGESGNPGGKSFTKIRQRLSQVCADEPAERADPAVTAGLGLPDDATWARCIVKAQVLKAAAGDTQAAYFLNSCVENAKLFEGAGKSS